MLYLLHEQPQSEQRKRKYRQEGDIRAGSTNTPTSTCGAPKVNKDAVLLIDSAGDYSSFSSAVVASIQSTMLCNALNLSDFFVLTRHLPKRGPAQLVSSCRISGSARGRYHTSVFAILKTQEAVITERSGLGRETWWPCSPGFVASPFFKKRSAGDALGESCSRGAGGLPPGPCSDGLP